jgi:copper chaperone NosL
VRRALANLGAVAALILVAACDDPVALQTLSLDPTDAGTAECAVCGMVVAEQPSPRGQVVHRDGQHGFFCSLGDLRAYLETPTAAGTPERVWVETLPAGFDPASRDASPRDWVPADEAIHVVGVDRAGIMGRPILSFADAASAGTAAALPGARMTTWAALRATPFNELPEETP